MSVDKELVDRLRSVFDEVDSVYKAITQELSHIDRRVSELYHTIEYSRFNAVVGYKLAKELQETLRRRRKIKQRLSNLDALRSVRDKFKRVEQRYNAL